jgi:cell division transport system permease protein
MDWGRLQFFLGEIRRNFTRNLIMQLTAIGTVTVTIVLLGAFLFTRQALTRIGDDVLHKIEISVFLKDGASADAAKALQAKIAADPRVAGVVFISKAEGLRQMRERLQGQIDTSLLTQNPLPDALRVKVVRPQEVRAVAETIRALPNVASVEYAHDIVERLLTLSDVFGKIGLGVVALLLFTAAIIISNTIRLTVFARRREIAIMRLVGASGTYIRLPFVVEGLIDGLLGATLALGILELGRTQLMPKLAVALPFVRLSSTNVEQLWLAAVLLGTGALIGVAASWISVGRYLRA